SDPWMRAAGAYWAARSAVALGDTATANAFLRLAAQAPQTFYGMLAERQVQMTMASAPTGQFIPASFRAPEPPKADLIQRDVRAHRAAALAQIGRLEEARQELRAGLALARTGEDRKAWTAMLTALGPVSSAGLQKPQYLSLGDYQTPPLEPKDGFTVDKALVYAIVRQESGFNPMAVSPVGAMGLMQLMPASAALATGDNIYRKRPRVLFNAATNLRAGQDYLSYLMDRGVGGDILQVVAAYNAGPGAVLKTTAMVGQDDPLLTIECLPALETRNYVEKVMAAYWTYKRMFGEETRTLDALAGGARRIDVRLDLPNATSPQPQIAAEPLQVGAAATLQAIALQ
ncbi:lytic transglycosylase domain-containing protein, partial [Phenylobacterium sp.]|uniref:lytic transglycosylase domain-containing protein n=1 Tax=Phenylobacterium sp. TaxID=1871053 RepID=UPI0025E31717